MFVICAALSCLAACEKERRKERSDNGGATRVIRLNVQSTTSSRSLRSLVLDYDTIFPNNTAVVEEVVIPPHF